MPACWRNGVKSEPDPSAPIRRSSRSRILFLSASVAARENRLRLRALPHAHVRLGIGDVPRHVVDEVLERVRSLHRQKAAAVAVGVEVHDGVRLQVGAVRLDPLGRSEQRRFFAVPGGIDHRPLRRPALLAQLAERARLFEQHGRAADRIGRAVDPRVVMVAAHDPLVRERAALHLRDDVVERLRVPVERDLQVHPRRPRADAIRDRQRAAPAVRRHRPADRRQQRLRVAVRDRQDRNLRERRRVLHGKPRRAWTSRRRWASADRPGRAACPSRCRAARRPCGRIGPSGNTGSPKYPSSLGSE